MKVEYPYQGLRCPICRRDRTLLLFSRTDDDREVRDGTLACRACGAQFNVSRGVAHLLVNPPEHVAREAAGLVRFAEFMSAHGWDRDRIRQLPDAPDGYWYAQRVSHMQLLDQVAFRSGESLLDVGSNTCWAANLFALAGLQVTALDISTAEMQGLYTADYFIEEGDVYFERVQGSMNEMPIASNSLDYVHCCEVLHHNDRLGLRVTFQEAYRVLKPGGRLLVVNETLKTLRDPSGVHDERVRNFDGYEHAHWAVRYRWEATRAGFRTRLLEPAYHEFFGLGVPREPPPRKKALRRRLLYEARSRPSSRRAYLAWLLHVTGRISLGMVATKPARHGSPPAVPTANDATGSTCDPDHLPTQSR